METQIFWYQTFNIYPVVWGFIFVLIFVVAMLKEKKPLPIEKIIVPSVAVLFLVTIAMYFHADTSATKGSKFSDDLVRWQEEADSSSDIELRPEMNDMIAYLQENNSGDFGSLVEIRDYLSYETLAEPYLSYLQFQKFDDFVAACDKRAGASHSYEKELSGYPVSVSEAKAYIQTLSNQGVLVGDCNLAVPLIALD